MLMIRVVQSAGEGRLLLYCGDEPLPSSTQQHDDGGLLYCKRSKKARGKANLKSMAGAAAHKN